MAVIQWLRDFGERQRYRLGQYEQSVTRNDGTDDGFRIQRITDRQGVGPSHKLAEEFFVDLALNDDSARIETDLALMKEGTEHRRVPVIAAMNGPATVHSEYALIADIIIAVQAVPAGRRKDVTMTSSTFSVEVITVPVSDVERALRFYNQKTACRLHIVLKTIDRTFCVCN